MARLEMARSDWLARCVGDLVAKIDRSSGRDHEKLVSLLINHEMALRSAHRSIQALNPAPTKVEKSRIDNDFALIRSAAPPETKRSYEPDSTKTSRPRGLIWEKALLLRLDRSWVYQNRAPPIVSASWAGRQRWSDSYRASI